MKQLISILPLSGISTFSTYAQPAREVTEVDQSRINRFLLITGLGYSASQVFALVPRSAEPVLYNFNDAPQWKQVDKVGPYSSYDLSHLGSRAFLNEGMSVRKSY